MTLVAGKGWARVALAAAMFVVVLAVACTSPAPTAQPEAGAPGGSLATAPALAPGVGQPTVGQVVTSGPSGTGAAAYPVGTMPVYDGVANGQQQGIFVSGDGEASAAPDVAILSLGIEARAATVSEARQKAAEAMGRLMASLRTDGVADKDIRTSYFNIYPEYSYVEPTYDRPGRQVIVGYQVTNQLTVKVRNLEKVGDVIDHVVVAGGELTRVQGISFAIEETKALAAKARENAVKDAIAKAQQFATLTGVTLGRLVYISESGGLIPPPYALGRAAVAEGVATTPISPGELEVRVSVQAVFAIQ